MKRNLIIVACIFVVVFLLGLTRINLVDTVTEENSENRDGHLIGVFITMEYLDLFDFETYAKDNASKLISGGTTIIEDTQEYQGRIYATLTDKVLTSEETGEKATVQDYVFEGLEGIGFYSATVNNKNGEGNYITNGTDGGISDAHVSYAMTDDGEAVTLEGTVYISPTIVSKSYYMNPVYQSNDGRIYVTTGSGMSQGGDIGEGTEISQNLDESYEVREDGTTKKNSCSVKITIHVLNPTKMIQVNQMDVKHTVISKQEYTPETIPESITPEEGASYLIVEKWKEKREEAAGIEREIYQKSDETLVTFLCRKDGICIKQYSELKW